MKRPALAAPFAAYDVPGEGALLLSAVRDVLLEGALFAMVVPRLDGRTSIEDLADSLGDELPAAEVWYAVRILLGMGCLVDGDAAPDPRDDVALETLAHSAGGTVLVGGRDLLDATVRHADARAQAEGFSWMPVCDVGGAHWIGPRLGVSPGDACWACLEYALETGRPAAALVRRRGLTRIGGEPAPLRVTAAQARAIRGQLDQGPDAVISIDADGSVTGRHPVRRRRACPRCGERAPATPTRPPRLGTRVAMPDDPARERQSEEFLLRHAALMDDVTGIARDARKLVIPGCDAVHVYSAGFNRARWDGTLAAMRRDLRRDAGGKGRTDVLARASLLGELAERASAIHRGDEARVVATLDELGAQAIHPNACMLFSDDQLDRAEVLATRYDPIPRRLPAQAPIGWTPVWSLTKRESRYLPSGYLYFDYAQRSAEPYSISDSNGNAAGATLEQAILQGLLELAERDAAGIWWHSRTRHAAVPLDSLDDEWSSRFVAQLGALAREAWILDLTNDLGIPVCVAVSRMVPPASEGLLFGFGAHLTRHDAAIRALGELAQMTAVFGQLGDDRSAYAAPLTRWLDEATVGVHPHLVPSGTARVHDGNPGHALVDVAAARDALAWCLARVEGAGLECLVLDQTRDDLGVPVAKVIVPGLRHFRRRLAPGRLFDVPVRMGWRPSAMAEHEANETTFPF